MSDENLPPYKAEAIDDLIPYARNARTHSDEQIAKIASSIREFGFLNPVIVDGESGIIAGHGRVMAARKLGIDTIPTVEASHLTEAQKRAYIIADNRLAEDAGWDNDVLGIELSELQDDGFDLQLTGFNDDEINQLLARNDATGEGDTDEDDAPEAQDGPATTQYGDTWLLGKHRVRCGDAKNVDVWDDLRVGDKFACVTSPPYNLAGGAKWRSGDRGKQQNAYDDYSDDVSEQEYQDMLQSITNMALAYCSAAAINVQPLAKAKRPLLRWLDKNADHVVDILTWDKGAAAPQMQAGVLASRYEWLVFLSSRSPASRVIPLSSWKGKYQSVYSAPPQKDHTYSSIHAATFPVHLPQFIIGDLMNKARGVVDPFMGTGTTLIAAEKLGRECRGIELSPSYCDVVVKRWQDFTGQQAKREADGMTFNEVANGESSA